MIQVVVIWPQNAKTGSFKCPSAVGNYAVGGLLFNPTGLEFFVSLNTGLGAVNYLCQGFADSLGNQNASAWGYMSGDMKTDRCIYVLNYLGIIQVNATLISMNADGFILNFTKVNNTFTVRWMAIG